MPRRRQDSVDISPETATQWPPLGSYAAPLCDWALLAEPLQLAVAREALSRAAETIAGQAMVLAEEMDDGGLPDRGGAEALRLFAAVVRVTGREANLPAGHA